MDQSMEQWRSVVGYEGLYEVSDHGRVRSLDRQDSLRRPIRGRMLRLAQTPKGHRWVTLRRGTPQPRYVHRLVLEAFVGPCPPGMEALHWDDEPANNRVTNLRWGTRGENMHDQARNGRHHMVQRALCPRGHDLVAPNLRASHARKGWRECLACHRERAAAISQGRPFDPTHADLRYAEIMASA